MSISKDAAEFQRLVNMQSPASGLLTIISNNDLAAYVDVVTADEQLAKALVDYELLAAGYYFPTGNWDTQGRWYPAEYHRCCLAIHQPSHQWPLVLQKHCRTIKHVAAAHRVNVSDLRKAHKKLLVNINQMKLLVEG